MTSKDVRDIMQLGPAPTSTPGLSTKGGGRSNGPPNPLQHQHKRPDGITRELYALIGDNAPSLQMIQPVKPKFKERIFNKKVGTGDSMKSSTSGKKKNGDKQVKWQLIGFTNPSRSQEEEKEKKKKLVLKHWVKDVPKNYIDGTPDTKFSKFNTTSQPFTYTEQEYQDYLKSLSDKWTKEETDHLFELVKEFDSRFIVVQDRWELTPLRSVDELKDRYYSICRTLAEKRPDPPIDPNITDPTSASALEMKEKLDKQRQETISSFSFDYSREMERKNYLKSLLERTRQQINEEDFLYVESRRIEQNYYKMNQERKELLKLLGQRDGIGIDYNNLASHQLLGIQPNGTTTSATSIRNSTGGGGGLQQGGVQANGAATLAGVNKRKMHGWEFEGNGNGLPEGWAGEGSKRKATAAQGNVFCLYIC
jgi:DNA methyltransferase 1-associated protein 1